MRRARWWYGTLVAGLGLAAGCANPCTHPVLYRISHPFEGLRHHNDGTAPPGPEGPVLQDFGPLPPPSPCTGPLPQSTVPTLTAPPRLQPQPVAPPEPFRPDRP